MVGLTEIRANSASQQSWSWVLAELGNYEDEEAFWEDLGYKMKEAWEHITLLKRTNLKLLLTGRDKGQPVIHSFNFIKLLSVAGQMPSMLRLLPLNYHSEQM